MDRHPRRGAQTTMGRAARWRDRVTAVLLMAAVAGCGAGDETAPAETAPAETAASQTAPAETAPSETAAEGAASLPASTPAQAPVDAQDFLAAADERCARTFVELDAVEYPTENSLSSIVAPFRQVAGINREQLEDLRAIAPPAGDEEVIGDLLDIASVGVDALDELVGAAGAGDVEAYDQALARIEQSAQQTYDQASAYGFSTCFTPPGG